MCFSPQASFSASLLLFGISYCSFKNLKSKEFWTLAAIPLMFAIQQTLEGLVWLAKMGYLSNVFESFAKYGFLLFAFVIWPFWMPFSCWHIEKEKPRRDILFLLLVLGSIISLTLFIQLFSGITVIASCRHLSYLLNASYSWTQINLMLASYVVVIIAPSLISSLKNLWILGIMTSITLLLSIAFFWYFLTSVWCFFAAIISAFTYLIIRK